MIPLFDEALVVASLLPVVMVAFEVCRAAIVRRRVRKMGECVERIAEMVAASCEPTYRDVCHLRSLFSERTIVEALRFLSVHIYGCALDRLQYLARYSCEGDYGCRKELLCNCDLSLQAIARLDTPLTIGEVARVTLQLRSVGASIAYTPLLVSQNRNLQFVGLYLCQLFSLTDAEPHLHRLAASEDGEISYAALFALCSIRGDLTTAEVLRAVERLAPQHRSALVRHAVQSCYSLHSCAHLFNPKERAEFAQRVSSYKCRIVCN